MAAMNYTPLQSEQLRRSRLETRQARKKGLHNVVALGLSGAGLALSLSGFPIWASLMLWGLAAVSWVILRLF